MTDKRFKSKRFMVDDAGELIDLDTHQFIDYGDEVVTLLNELHEEKEYWKERAKVRLNNSKEAHMYWDCLEKAIEQVCPDDIQELVWAKYEELEKEVGK